MRSRNINAPVDGVRPNPALRRHHPVRVDRQVVERSADRRHARSGCSCANAQPAMFNVNYTLGHEKNFADGATSLPSDSLNPDLDWGPSRQDIRHRLQVQAQRADPVRNARQREPERELGRALQHDHRPRRQRRRRVQRPSGRRGPQLTARRYDLGAEPQPEPSIRAWRRQHSGGAAAGSASAALAAVAATRAAARAWSSSSRRRTFSTT